MVCSISELDSRKLENFQKLYSCENEEKDYFKIFSHYVQSSSGIYRFYKLLSDFCKLPMHYAKQLSLPRETYENLFKLNDGFKFLTKNLILTKIGVSAYDMKASYQKYLKAEVKDLTRNRDKFAKKTSEFVSDGMFLLQLGEFLSIYSLRALSQPINFLGNFFSLITNAFSVKLDNEEYFDHCNMGKSVELQKPASSRLKIIFHEIKKMDQMKMVKSISSVVLSVFVIIEIIFKYAVLPPGGMLLASSASTLLAIWLDFYQKSLSYPMIS
ncbi:MAG: hypothetical protein WCT85_05635 [Parachlamydiales bacterium]|jgi:hypothetical protein